MALFHSSLAFSFFKSAGSMMGGCLGPSTIGGRAEFRPQRRSRTPIDDHILCSDVFLGCFSKIAWQIKRTDKITVYPVSKLCNCNFSALTVQEDRIK